MEIDYSLFELNLNYCGITKSFFLSCNAIKVPVVVATGVGVVITGGLVLIVPAINKDMT